jgi:hypothetical protein
MFTFVRFNIEIFQHQLIIVYFVGETTVYRLLTNQIKQLEVDIRFDKNQSNIFLLILSLGKHLTDLTFHHRFSFDHPPNRTFDQSSTHISSTLTKLIINVPTFYDCLYLLDGRLRSLAALIIDIHYISYPLSTIDKTVILSSIILCEEKKRF